MTHPKNLEVGQVYAPDEWKINENSYYSISRNSFGYWATHYYRTESTGRFYPMIVNDKIAKRFSTLAAKVDKLIERRK